MQHLSNVMLVESEIRGREREVRLACDGFQSSGRPVAWRAYLVVALVVIGLIVWWII